MELIVVAVGSAVEVKFICKYISCSFEHEVVWSTSGRLDIWYRIYEIISKTNRLSDTLPHVNYKILTLR